MVTDAQNGLDPTETALLGVVKHVQGDAHEPLFCRIQPLFQQSGNSWIPIVDSTSVFPDIGLVFWWRPHQTVSKDDALIFQVAEFTYYEMNKRRDVYQVRNETTAVPVEIANVADQSDIGTLRRRIASGALSASLPPIGQAILASPSMPDRWIGLFEAKRQQQNDNAGNLSSPDASSGFVRTYQIDPNDFQTIVLDGAEHLILRPGTKLAPPVGYFNVQTDADLVKGLANIVRRELNTAEASSFRKRAIEQAVSLLVEGRSRDPQRDNARLEAARTLQDDLIASESEIKEIEGMLDALPLLQEIRSRTIAAAESQAAEELAQLRDQAHAEIALERQNAVRQLEDARIETNSLKSQLEETLQEAKTAFEGLIKNTVASVAEHAVMRSLFGDIKNRPTLREPIKYAAPPPLSSLDELSERTISIANSRGEDAYVVGIINAILAGSQVALLAGLRAFSLSTVAAHSLGGGASCVVSISPTLFSLTDLMNAPCAPVGRLPCYALTLGEFVTRAMQHDHLSVVILQGVNRAPPENILLELADSAVGTSHGLQTSWRDSRGEIKEAKLDRRILFLATLTEGSSTFRFPGQLGARLPLIWADRRVLPRATADTSSVIENHSVPFNIWKTTSDFKCNDLHSIVEKFLAISDYPAMLPSIANYLINVSGLIGSEKVGIAEGLWALACGRLDDEKIKNVTNLFDSDQTRLFRSAIEAGENRCVSSYFDRSNVR